MWTKYSYRWHKFILKQTACVCMCFSCKTIGDENTDCRVSPFTNTCWGGVSVKKEMPSYQNRNSPFKGKWSHDHRIFIMGTIITEDVAFISQQDPGAKRNNYRSSWKIGTWLICDRVCAVVDWLSCLGYEMSHVWDALSTNCRLYELSCMDTTCLGYVLSSCHAILISIHVLS